MLDEALPLLRALLAGEHVDHRGEHYTLTNAQFHPAPTAKVPFWIAARWPNRRPMARAARYDGLFVIDVETRDLPGVLADVTTARGSLDAFDVVVRTQDHTSAGAWEAAGATWWLADFDPFTCDIASVRRAISGR
jgi:alkanesulfonate monooxygenase SsuD/methylene tetrahydromethanopterin reductase-like flavin-dependent oxidoreductase (luciferase family)